MSDIITQGYGADAISDAPTLTLTLVAGVVTIGRTDVDFATAYTLMRGTTVLTTDMGASFADTELTGNLSGVVYTVFGTNDVGDGPESTISILALSGGSLSIPRCVIDVRTADTTGVVQGTLTVLVNPPTVLDTVWPTNVPITVTADSTGLIRFIGDPDNPGVPQQALVQIRVPKAGINRRLTVPSQSTYVFTG